MYEYPIIIDDLLIPDIFSGKTTQIAKAVEPQPIWDGKKWNWNNICYWLSDSDDGPSNLLLGLHDNRCGPPTCYCPYGQPGDRLWVQESWQLLREGSCTYIQFKATEHCWDTWKIVSPAILKWLTDGSSKYGKDIGVTKNFIIDKPVAWKSPELMPKWASRLTLTTTDIKMKRNNSVWEWVISFSTK